MPGDKTSFTSIKTVLSFEPEEFEQPIIEEPPKKSNKIKVLICLAVLVVCIPLSFWLYSPDDFERLAVEGAVKIGLIDAQKSPDTPAIKERTKKRPHLDKGAPPSSLLPSNVVEEATTSLSKPQEALDLPYKVQAQVKPEAELYTRLENISEVKDPTVVWTVGDKKRWETAVKSPHRWQHYKTATEIARNPKLGAKKILFQLLQKPGFWLHMRTLMALASNGYLVDSSSVKQSVENVSPDLIFNFIKRFYMVSNAGEQYILRAMLSWVEERERLLILKILAKFSRSVNAPWIYAARYDPSKLVSRWAERRNIDVDSKIKSMFSKK